VRACFWQRDRKIRAGYNIDQMYRDQVRCEDSFRAVERGLASVAFEPALRIVSLA
jgi:hypothetical protein